MTTTREWQGRTIKALSTLQMASPGHAYTLLGPPQSAYGIHLIRVAANAQGTPGPTLCGIDRFAKGTPGWSVGGGVSGPEIDQIPCPGCVEVACSEYPDLPLEGSVGREEIAAAIGTWTHAFYYTDGSVVDQAAAGCWP
jgi:hypothetical protein